MVAALRVEWRVGLGRAPAAPDVPAPNDVAVVLRLQQRGPGRGGLRGRLADGTLNETLLAPGRLRSPHRSAVEALLLILHTCAPFQLLPNYCWARIPKRVLQASRYAREKSVIRMGAAAALWAAWARKVVYDDISNA